MKGKQAGLLIVLLTLLVTFGCQTHEHIYGEWSTTTAATCTTDGVETRSCSCGEKETKTINAKGHSFGNWSTVTAATCTADGAETRSCSCGEKETKTINAKGSGCEPPVEGPQDKKKEEKVSRNMEGTGQGHTKSKK